jgi:Spy/CpxP family protein refolding chaperone
MLILPAAALFAQSPPQPPEARFDEVKAAVGLTDEQVSQLLQLRRDERQALRLTFQPMREKQRALHESLQAGGADPTTLGQLLLDIENLKQQARDTNDQFQTQALGLLSNEQKANLQTLEEAAKLRSTIGQATGLNLLKGPAPQGARSFLRSRRRGQRGPAGAGPMGFGRKSRLRE